MPNVSATPNKTKAAQAKDLQAMSQWVAASPKKDGRKFSNTKEIMLGLARAQHKVPNNVKDSNPALVGMVIIEDQARKLEMKKLDSIDRALTSINEDINRIKPESREHVQMKDEYEKKAKTIQLDYKIIAAKQDKFQHDLNTLLDEKDNKLAKIAENLARGETPDFTALNSVKTNFQELDKQSQTIAKEASGFNYKVDHLKLEVSNVVQAIEGPVGGVGYRPGE